METAFWLLAVAFIGGITALAYRSPSEYESLNRYMMVIIASILIGGALYQSGYQSGAIDASRFFQANPGKPVYDGSPFPFSTGRAFALITALWCYLYILLWLPALLNSESRPDGSNKRKDDKAE